MFAGLTPHLGKRLHPPFGLCCGAWNSPAFNWGVGGRLSAPPAVACRSAAFEVDHQDLRAHRGTAHDHPHLIRGLAVQGALDLLTPQLTYTLRYGFKENLSSGPF